MDSSYYSSEQIKALASNPNVAKCSPKSITYNKDFKIKAVKTYFEQRQSPNTIFRMAGFDLNIIGAYRPKGCLRDWRNIYKTKGEAALAMENRGRGKRKRVAVK